MRSVLTVLLLATACYHDLSASGSKSIARRGGASSSRYFTKDNVKLGEEIFNDAASIGGEKMSCSECHSAGKSAAFKRTSLKKNAKNLYDSINLCCIFEN